MKYINIITGISLYALLLLSFSSCRDILDTDPKEVVESANNFQNVYDADNAIWGLYGKVSNLAENVVVLNELRADMMDVTPNSTADQISLNNHTETESNSYCNVKPFYEVILNANDILSNFDKMLANKKISKDNYDVRYSDVVAIRSWTYLQLGIHFKDVTYVTDPLLSIEALSDSANLQKKSLDELIPQLISDMEHVPTLVPNTLSSYYNQTITDNNKTFFLNLQFIDKHILLGDLYLWNNQYVAAGTQYKAYMDAADAISNKTNIKNKVSTWVWTNGSTEPRFQICYQRYKELDVTSYRNMWKEMFIRPSTDNATSGSIGLQDEMIWMFSYSGSVNSVSPFVKLFAINGEGKYQIKPSAYAIDSLWETQVQQSNGFVFDGRGRESSFDYVNGQPVVLKYLYDYYNTSTTDVNKTIHLDYNNITNKLTKPGKWFLYRAALLHLRYAEAANRAGYPRLAYALLNNGVKSNFDWIMADGKTYRSDKEGVQYSSFKPANDTDPAKPYPAPFYLDARQNDAPYTYLRSPWRENGGIRGRAYLNNITTPAYVHDGIGDDHNDSIQWIEQSLIKEAALECGFEGQRWGDLLRVARRNSKEGKGAVSTIMSNAIARKFNAAKTAAPSINESNLFLPMKK